MKTPDHGYTVVVVPEGNGQISRWRLTPQRLRRMLVGAGVAVALFVLAGGYALYNLATLPDRWRMEERMLAQRMHLATLSDKLAQTQKTVDRVARLERKLRVVLGEGAQADERTVRGVGGPTAEELSRFDSVLDTDSRLELARLDVELDEVRHSATVEELRLHDLRAVLSDQKSRLASTPSIWPTRGWVTSTFGLRTSPFTGSKRMHDGMDIATRLGNPVVSTADGVVLYAGVKSGYGKVVILDHGYGLGTRYGHLSKIEVSAGEEVTRGQTIARVGNTGRSTGPHLHYEVRLAGAPVNPSRYILLEDEQLP